MKPTSKILLLMLTVSVIGIGLPSTFSIGDGQHKFSQIDPNNPDEFCNKCHGNGDIINAELTASGNGTYNNNIKIHSTVSCVNCHEVTGGYGASTPGNKTEHAATIPTCTKCHTGQGSAVFMGDVSNELNGTAEAHQGFNDDIACIGCHTSVEVTGSISYTYSEGQVRSGLTIGS